MRGSVATCISAASALGALVLATPASAQSPEDDFWVQLSGYWASIDTDVSLSSIADPDIGTELDLETDLNLDESELMPAIFAGARLGGGFTVGAEFYSLGRDGPVTLERDIIIQDVTYPASVDVISEFNTDIYRVTVGYAFVRNQTVEVGAALGLHATDIEFIVNGQGRVGSSMLQIETREAEFLAPLPTLGLFASFQLMPGLSAGARVDFLSLKVDDYDGRLINAQASLTYRFLRNVGVGVAYRFVDYRVDVEKEQYVGRFAYEFTGPSVFLEIGF